MSSGERLDDADSSIDSSTRLNSLHVKQFSSKEIISWNLPPSKSHAIRTLFLASQSQDSIEIFGINNSGQDVNSMKNCLIQLGVKMEKVDREYGVSNLNLH